MRFIDADMCIAKIKELPVTYDAETVQRCIEVVSNAPTVDMTKQEVLNYLDNVLHPIVSPDNWNVYSELHDMIEELPSTDPVRHGKWREYPSADGLNQCSVCGVLRFGNSNYCPNCGADMRGE